MGSVRRGALEVEGNREGRAGGVEGEGRGKWWKGEGMWDWSSIK